MARRKGAAPAIMASLFAAVASALSLGTRAGVPDGTGSLKGWTSLTLGAEKAVLFTANADLTVSEGTHTGTGRPAVIFKTHSTVRLLGATGFEEETTSWIDREKRRPLEFFQLRPAESARRYLFLDGMVRQTNWEPPVEDKSGAFSRWKETETTDRRFSYADGSSPEAGESLTDFYSLIFLLRDLDLSAVSSEPREFTTIYRRHLMKIRVVPGERRRNEREALNEATGARETLKLSERRIKLKPLGAEAESFRGLMGMQGDTEIWLDEASGGLLEIDGEAPGFGATAITLRSFRR
ncbi:MAG TPA: hypothetical protein VGK94_00110 [Candidatus Polarisedimenticolia bacterium]